MRDLDEELVRAALERGLITEEERDRVLAEVEAARSRSKPLYAAQWLVKERVISCRDLLTLQNHVKAQTYECPHCQRRFARSDLPRKRAKDFPCPGCAEPIRMEAKSSQNLSLIEVLTSRDPRDLTVPMVRGGLSNSQVSEVQSFDLERFEIRGELGRGGYGVVFDAYHLDLELPIALKVLRASTELPPVTLERFLREGRAVSRLEHPNVVRVYDIGRYRDLLVLAMERVQGVPLKQHLKRNGGSLTPEQALPLFEEILEGVGHAHERGVIHRDLKPANILIEDDLLENGEQRPKLIDFGLARDLQSNAVLTQAHTIVGTPSYLSPEQIQGRSAEADARSDIFSLGVILYEALSGRRPFEAKTKQEVYAKILNDAPKPITRRVPDLPPALAEVVHRALDKDPERRFPSAVAFRDALRASLDASEPAPAAPKRRKPRRAPSRSSAARRPSSSSSTPALAVGGVLAFLLVVGLLWSRGGGTDEVAQAPESVEPVEPVEEPEPVEVPEEVALPVELDPVEPVEDPEPDPVPAVVPEPEPVEPDPVEPEPVEPDPVPVVVPEPEPVELDRGEHDASMHPDLADDDEETWLARAFLINSLSEDPDTPHAIRGLRLALRDRHPLNPAFALRGLQRAEDELLRRVGSQGLFEGLLPLLGSDEPYVARSAQALLARLGTRPGGAAPRARAASEWRGWWASEGELWFREVASRPLAPVVPDRGERPERMQTQSREGQQYFSELRRRGLQIVMLLDVTASMADELQRVRDQVSEITSLMDLILGRKVELGFVTYGDVVVQRCPLTRRLDDYARAVRQIEIFDDPNDKTISEGVSVALESALARDMEWGRRSQRVLLLLADAPPLQPARARELVEEAHEHGFVFHALIAQAPERYERLAPAGPDLEELARLGGGVAIQLDDAEEVLTRLLVLGLGPSQEEPLRAFVQAYREVTAPGR